MSSAKKITKIKSLAPIKVIKPASGSALTPAARAAVAGFFGAIQRNPAAAVVALGALALGVLLIFG